MLHACSLTRIARKTVAEMPSATVNSPRSLGRVKLLSNDDENILDTFQTHTDNRIVKSRLHTCTVFSTCKKCHQFHEKEKLRTLRKNGSYWA